MRIYNGIYKFTLGKPEIHTPVSLMNISPKKSVLNSLSDIKNPFSQTDIVGKKMCNYFVINIDSSNFCDDEKIYGFGLCLKSFEQTGKKRIIRTNADPLCDTGESHAPAPTYVSSAGYLILIDTFAQPVFYVKRDNKNTVMVEIEGVDGADVYIFAGDNLLDAISRYNLFSGGGPSIPLWGLGVWYRAYGQANSSDILALGQHIRENHIPCDVLGLESGWQSHSYSCSFVWDKKKFSEPDKFIAKLNKNGFKLNLWEHAFTNKNAPFYQDIKVFCADRKVWNGLVPDFMQDEGRHIFADFHKNQLIDKGIKGFKLDECDGSDYTGGWSYPDSTVFPSGFDGKRMHNAFGTLYQNTIENIFTQNGERTYGSVRNAYAINANSPFVIYSDLYGKDDYMYAMVNMGFSGLLWCPEVREGRNETDFLQRLAMVVCSPQCVINGWYLKNPPWLQIDKDLNCDNKFMKNKDEFMAKVKDLLNLRMSLIHYLYSAFMAYRNTGKPPFRAIMLDFYHDKKTHYIHNQYMMGDSILVAPLLDDKTQSRSVYLPENSGNYWYDFYSGKKYVSGTYEISCDESKVPLFVKENSVIAIAKAVEYVKNDTTFNIDLWVYGKNSHEITLYEDDGESLEINQNTQNELKINIYDNGAHILRIGNYKHKRIEISNVITK